jgi:hypothetical protein
MFIGYSYRQQTDIFSPENVFRFFFTAGSIILYTALPPSRGLVLRLYPSPALMASDGEWTAVLTSQLYQ